MELLIFFRGLYMQLRVKEVNNYTTHRSLSKVYEYCAILNLKCMIFINIFMCYWCVQNNDNSTGSNLVRKNCWCKKHA